MDTNSLEAVQFDENNKPLKANELSRFFFYMSNIHIGSLYGTNVTECWFQFFRNTHQLITETRSDGRMSRAQVSRFGIWTSWVRTLV